MQNVRPIALAMALSLMTLPALASGVEADWHFLPGGGALRAAADLSLSRFFALEATGWLPLADGAAGAPNLVDGRALFTIPVSSFLGLGVVIAPWAGYRAAFTGSNVSHGPGFGLQLAVENHDFPLSFKVEGGAFPFMSNSEPNWFEYAGSVGYQVMDNIQVHGGFRGIVQTGGAQPIMGPFLGARFGT